MLYKFTNHLFSLPVQPVPSLNDYKDDAPDQKGSEEKTQDENRAPSDDDKCNSPLSKKAKLSNGFHFTINTLL